MKKNTTNKKNRAGLLITAAALTLTAVFAAGTVSAGAVSINKATGYSQSVASAKETLASPCPSQKEFTPDTTCSRRITPRM